MKQVTRRICGFAIAAALMGILVSCDSSSPEASGGGAGSSGGQSRGGSGGGRPAPLVVASEVNLNLINNRLKAVGNGEAVSSVSVVPLSGGIITDVLVSPGQQVEKSATLVTLDSEEQQIALDRAARAASEAEIDATRLAQLFRSRTATQVELSRAEALQLDAKLAMDDAELRLRRRTITAPISGIVGFVSVDPGNYITAQSELMTIDDRSSIVVEFWIPERFANLVEIGQSIEAVALADPATQYTGILSGIGSRIESDSRTLPVKAVIENDKDKLRPGMSFELVLDFPGQQFPGVNPLAIQWDSEGSYVWKIVEGKVQRVPARIIQRNPESILVEAELAPGDQVVSEGLLALRSGASVRIQGAQVPPAPEQGGGGGTGSGDEANSKSNDNKPAAAAEASATGATGS